VRKSKDIITPGSIRPVKIICVMLVLILSSFTFSPSAWPAQHVNVITISEIINPAISEYISKMVDKSVTEGANCLIIQLDTPGGLDLSMRDIIKSIMNARIPVIVYVAPGGARAASAGVMITMAADVAAMAPGTNIGAAHPVAMGGGKMDESMMEKVENDAVAYAKSIAAKKGRNEEWAEEAVRKSVSITAEEALKLKVIDIVAKDMQDLLEKLEGRVVEKEGQKFTLNTRGVEVRTLEMGWRQRILNALSNPNIAYILLMMGLAGLYFEFSNPGSILPGVIGAISLILAFYALQTLPINYAGILLIILGVILFIAEIKITSYGLLSVGGVISLTLGSLMLFESPEPYFRVSLSVVLPTILLTSGFFIVVVGLVVKAHRARPTTGMEGMVGLVGIAKSPLGPKKPGKVYIHGEYWNAISDDDIQENEEVQVLEVKNFRMKVKRAL
jgi:membrane-bound serine protease (ClpP class)